MTRKAMFHFTHWDSARREFSSFICIYFLWQRDLLKIRIICFFNQYLALTKYYWNRSTDIYYSHTYNIEIAM